MFEEFDDDDAVPAWVEKISAVLVILATIYLAAQVVRAVI